jgi:transcriptional regulator with XRE-family HTH domain
LGRELQTLRHRRGISQERLAFLAEVHPTYISLLENGRKSPTIDVLERLAGALGVRLSTIIAGSERNSNSPNSDG